MKSYILIPFLLILSVISSCNKEADSNNAVKDIDGNSYPTIKIGNQVWMAKNLNVSKYRNGDPIPEVRNASQWRGLAGRWCYYDNDPANGPVYGKLYNFFAVKDPRGLAPNGWHIPSKAEWDALIDYLGGAGTAGGTMKATTLWDTPNDGATNSSGFTALPAGGRSDFGFDDLGKYAGFWSSTEFLIDVIAVDYSLWYSDRRVDWHESVEWGGSSIRCIKD